MTWNQRLQPGDDRAVRQTASCHRSVGWHNGSTLQVMGMALQLTGSQGGASGRGPFRRFMSWWLAELASMLPSFGWLRRRREIVLPAGESGVRLLEKSGQRLRNLVGSDLSVHEQEAQRDRLLAGFAMNGDRPDMVVLLPSAEVFSRVVALPQGALGDAGRILALDLEQATPLRRRDVLIAHRIIKDGTRLVGAMAPTASRSAAVSGRVMVEQLVVKRSTVAAASLPLMRAGLSPDRIDIDDGGGRGAGIDFLAEERSSPAPERNGWTVLLLATGAALIAASAGVAATRLEAAVEAAEAEAAAARVRFTRIEDGRRRVDEATASAVAVADLKSREMPRAVLVDALTRLLPDTDYLTSMRIEGNTIELTGYAASTATLVPLIERSGVVRKASLTAPATFDDRALRERFVLRAEIVGQGR